MSQFYEDSVFWIDVEKIHPNPFQPRREFDQMQLQSLSDSIRQYGVLQALVVTRKEVIKEDGGLVTEYELIAGERRLRASKLAGLAQVPALIKIGDETNDLLKLELAIIENVQREDLNPLEEAQGLARLIAEFGLTHDAAAKAVGRSRSAVTNLLRLTALAPAVQEYLLSGAIEMGHARALLALPEAQQGGAAARVVNGELSVRETERLVHTLANPAQRANRAKAKPAYDADTARLENDLAEKFGAVVRIEPGRKGAGRVVIRYSSLDQLDGIIAKLR